MGTKELSPSVDTLIYAVTSLIVNQKGISAPSRGMIEYLKDGLGVPQVGYAVN